MRWRLPCRVSTRLLTDLDDGTLPWGLALRVRLHLGACRPCRRLHRDLRALAGLVAPAAVRAPEPLPAPPLVLGPAPVAGAGPAPRRPWPATPVPGSVARALAGPDPGPALGRMAQVHAVLAGQRRCRQAGLDLPPWLLTLLPPAGGWPWRRLQSGPRQEVVQADPDGTRLVLGWAPAGVRIPPPGLRSASSCLILQGAAGRRGARYAAGDWLAARDGWGSLGALPPGCWYLLEVGRTERAAPAPIHFPF